MANIVSINLDNKYMRSSIVDNDGDIREYTHNISGPRSTTQTMDVVLNCRVLSNEPLEKKE